MWRGADGHRPVKRNPGRLEVHGKRLRVPPAKIEEHPQAYSRTNGRCAPQVSGQAKLVAAGALGASGKFEGNDNRPLLVAAVDVTWEDRSVTASLFRQATAAGICATGF